MKLEEIKEIAVLGAGVMGHGIAQAFIMGGYPVKLYDVQDGILATARAHIEESLELFQQAGLILKEGISAAVQRLTTSADLRYVAEGSDFIVEAAPENLVLKQELFRQVESFCGEDTIIASNTSSLTLKNIGTLVRHKDRLVVTHWFNPPQIVPAVEVVKGEETSEETLDTVYGLMQRIKKQPVRINKELPGFLVNRIQLAMAREVFDLYQKGVASAEDIDKAVKGSIGFRLAGVGLLRTADLGGLDVWLKVAKNLFPEIQSSTEPPDVLERLVAQGHYGIKTGKGFYEYTADFQEEKLDEAVKARDRDFLVRLKNLYWDVDQEEKEETL